MIGDNVSELVCVAPGNGGGHDAAFHCLIEKQ